MADYDLHVNSTISGPTDASENQSTPGQQHRARCLQWVEAQITTEHKQLFKNAHSWPR